MDNKVLWFLIFMLISCTIVWLIGSFITLDMLWFWHSTIGRIIAIIFFIIFVAKSIEEVEKF